MGSELLETLRPLGIAVTIIPPHQLRLQPQRTLPKVRRQGKGVLASVNGTARSRG